MKTVKARCHVCGSEHTFVNQELNEVRTKVCMRCSVRLTVTSSEGYPGPPAMPDRERVTQHKDVTKKEADTARRLLVEAFGGKE